MTKTFTAIDHTGTTIFSSRGKTGAAQKAIDALAKYRADVKVASGSLYGHPWTLGHIEVDGIRAEDCGNAGMYIADDIAG